MPLRCDTHIFKGPIKLDIYLLALKTVLPTGGLKKHIHQDKPWLIGQDLTKKLTEVGRSTCSYTFTREKRRKEKIVLEASTDQETLVPGSKSNKI